MKLFLSKGFLAHFRGFVVWSVHVSKSGHPRIDRTLSVRRIVMSCFRPDESPKFGIVLRSSNRRSRDRRNHVVPESKPNPASPQPTLKMKPFLSISYQNVFLAHFRGFVAFVVLWFGLSKFQNLTVHVSIVRCQYEELFVNMPFEAVQARKDSCLFCLSKSSPTTIL